VVSRRTLYWRWQRNSPLDIHHGQAHWGAAPCSVLARTGFEWRSSETADFKRSNGTGFEDGSFIHEPDLSSQSDAIDLEFQAVLPPTVESR
jgi:hypothetical protein